MSIINDAIKKARREFEVKSGPVTKGPVKTDTPPAPSPVPSAGPGASELKWTVVLVISLAVIASLLGSLVLYKNMSDIKAGISSSRSVAESESPVSFTPAPARRKILPLNLSGSNNILLNGIVYEPTDKWAIINDRIVREGDRLSGGTLVLIEKDSVKIRKNTGEELILELR